MHRKTSLTVIAIATGLICAAPASADRWWADHDQGAVAGIAQQATSSYPDWFERLAAAHSVREPAVDDHFRLDPTSAAAPAAAANGRDIEWAQIRVAFAVGALLAAGLVVAARSTRFRALTH